MKISLLFYSSVLAQVNPSPFQIATGSMKWTPESKEFKHREALIANDIKNIKEYDPDSTVLKEKATIGYIKNSIQNCNFFIFRHHRSAADQFERIIKTDVNSYFLDLIYAIRGDREIKNSKMNQIVRNYELKSKRCEPILLSNVLLVEKYHTHYYAKIYSKIPEGDSQQTLLHETLYIRMRSIERSMNGGKRHKKAVEKKPSFRDDFLWKSVLSSRFRDEIGKGKEDNEKLDAYVKKYFKTKSKLPALIPLFDKLFVKYHTLDAIADRKLKKPEQLLNYWFDNILVDKKNIGPNSIGPNPPLLDLDFWPADQKQADQMKRWISGSNRPWMGLHYHDKYFFIDHLIKDLVTLIVTRNLQGKIAEKIGNSWFTRMVNEEARNQKRDVGIFPVVASLNDENADEHNSSIMWSTSMLFMLVV